MLIDRDYDGWYEWCLQCGYRRDLIGTIKAQLQAKAGKRVAGKRVAGKEGSRECRRGKGRDDIFEASTAPLQSV